MAAELRKTKQDRFKNVTKYRENGCGLRRAQIASDAVWLFGDCARTPCDGATPVTAGEGDNFAANNPYVWVADKSPLKAYVADAKDSITELEATMKSDMSKREFKSLRGIHKGLGNDMDDARNTLFEGTTVPHSIGKATENDPCWRACVAVTRAWTARVSLTSMPVAGMGTFIHAHASDLIVTLMHLDSLHEQFHFKNIDTILDNKKIKELILRYVYIQLNETGWLPYGWLPVVLGTEQAITTFVLQPWPSRPLLGAVTEDTLDATLRAFSKHCKKNKEEEPFSELHAPLDAFVKKAS